MYETLEVSRSIPRLEMYETLEVSRSISRLGLRKTFEIFSNTSFLGLNFGFLILEIGQTSALFLKFENLSIYRFFMEKDFFDQAFNYPPASEASREVANFIERKIHIPPYMVSKYLSVCLSVT